MFWLQNVIFGKVTTSRCLTTKNCRTFGENKLNFSNFFFLKGFTVVFHTKYFFWKFLFFKNKPPQKGGIKMTKKYHKILGNVLVLSVIFCKLTTSWYLDIFSSYGQKVTFIREFHCPGFFKKKRCFSRPKLEHWYFFLLMGPPPYLEGINYLNRPLKKKIICVFLNQFQKYGNFCENSHFSKIIAKNGEVRRGRNFCPMEKIHQKNISSDIYLDAPKVLFSYCF